MKRAISPVIAIVVLMLMTVSAAGMAYLTITTYQDQATGSAEGAIEQLATVGQSQIKVESIGDGKLYLRSIGGKCESLIVQVGDEPAQVLGDCDTSLEAFDLSSTCESGYQTVKITSGGQTITQRVQCSELVGAPAEGEEGCDIQFSVLSGQYASTTQESAMAIPMSEDDLLGNVFTLPSDFHTTSVDVRLDGVTSPSEIRVYLTNTDPSTTPPWSLFDQSQPNGTAVAEPGDSIVNVPVNASLNSGSIYVMITTNNTASNPSNATLSAGSPSVDDTAYLCGPVLNGFTGCPTSCNEPSMSTNALLNMWINIANCDCGNGIVDAGEDCGNCWEDAGCPEGEGCSDGECVACDTACDGVCLGRGCYGTDPDCDAIGTASLTCCGNGKCESGEDSSTCIEDCPYHTYSFSDGDYAKTLSFSGSGSDTSASIKINKSANIEHATVDLVGATNNFNPYVEKVGSVNFAKDAGYLFVSGDYAYVANKVDGFSIMDVSNPQNPVFVGDNNDRSVYDLQVIDVGSDEFAYTCENTGLGVYNVTNKTGPARITGAPVGTCEEDIQVSGDFVYLLKTGVEGGIGVINITNRTNPEEIGGWEDAEIKGLQAVGDYLFTVSGTGFRIFNATNKTNPTLLSEIEHIGGDKVYVQGDYAYVAGSQGFTIIDVSDESDSFATSGYYPDGLHLQEVKVVGDYAYATGDYYDSKYLYIFDVSDKENPTVLVKIPANEEYTRGVFVSGNYAYFTEGEDSPANGYLNVVNVTDVNSLFMGRYDEVVYSANDLSVSGDYAFVAEPNFGLRVIDVTDKSNPLRVGSIPLDNDVRSVFSESQDYVYVKGLNDLFVVNVSDKSKPRVMGVGWSGSSSGELFVLGDYAYISEDSNPGGLIIVNVTNKSNLETTATLETAYYARDVFVEGDWAYLAQEYGGEGGLSIVNVTNKSNPFVHENVSLASQGLSVWVDGDYAYVGVDHGLKIVDVSDKDNPVVVGNASSSIDFEDVQVVGDYAYISSSERGEGGMQIVDVSNKTNPVVVGGDYVWDGPHIQVSGDYAYLAANHFGVLVYDVSDPTNPQSLVDKFGSADTLAVSDDNLYVGTTFLNLFDISDKSSPSKSYDYDYFSSKDMRISGDYMYTTSRMSDGFRPCVNIFDISSPSNPSLSSTTLQYRSPGEICVSGDTLYASGYSSGLHYVDITDETSPFSAGVTDFTDSVGRVRVQGDYAYVSTFDGSNKLQIVDVDSKSVVGSAVVAGHGNGVSVQDDYAYLSDAVVDVSDRANPSVMYDRQEYGGHSFVAGNYSYVFYDSHGLAVFNVSNKTGPSEVVEVGHDVYEYGEGLVEFRVVGDYLYVASPYHGLLTYRVADSEYPDSPSIDAGDDDQYVFSVSGQDYPRQVVDVTSDLQQVLDDGCVCSGCVDDGENCTIPVGVAVSGGSGQIILKNLYLSYR